MGVEYYKHTCACGCGGKIKVQKYHRNNRIPSFLPYHCSRILVGESSPNWKGVDHKAYRKKWCEENKERIRKLKKEWYLKNKKHAKAKRALYYKENKHVWEQYKKENKDKINKQRREWIKNNKGKRLLYQRRWVKKIKELDPERLKKYRKTSWFRKRLNPEEKEKRKIYSDEYRKSNPEKIRALSRKKSKEYKLSGRAHEYYLQYKSRFPEGFLSFLSKSSLRLTGLPKEQREEFINLYKAYDNARKEIKNAKRKL
jgi:hypothetical protein